MQIEMRNSSHPSVDLEISAGGLFATIALRQQGSTLASQWFVTGPSAESPFSLLLSLTAPLASVSENKAAQECRALAEAFIFPLAAQMRQGSGLFSIWNEVTAEDKSNLFRHHMTNWTHAIRNAGMTLQAETEALFLLATSFQVPRPIKEIAEFQGVATTTVETRIRRARAAGKIPTAASLRKPKQTVGAKHDA